MAKTEELKACAVAREMVRDGDCLAFCRAQNLIMCNPRSVALYDWNGKDMLFKGVADTYDDGRKDWRVYQIAEFHASVDELRKLLNTRPEQEMKQSPATQDTKHKYG